MSGNNIGQILNAFSKFESKLVEQSGMLKELTAKVNSLENQNKKLVDIVQKMQQSSPTKSNQVDQQKHNFQDKVEQHLCSIEEKSKKTLELVKSNTGNSKKRAWP
ncbi:hypothetical protein [Vibrio marisflavi]|uniref:Uncharacterized protein n=1 Tax=Vibrio marisflavi CECT 7928 TaxID=634439 RepID=A0ABN8E1L4_9VIBR|nr:hypothetical protein [Vibrio marisflavi]CAH0536828.1 hypothetical protein VMF7928_00718 [Vibrio marisflavi CECT 7928]